MNREELQRIIDLKKQILDNLRIDIPDEYISFMFEDYKDKIVLHININSEGKYELTENGISRLRPYRYEINKYDAIFEYKIWD